MGLNRTVRRFIHADPAFWAGKLSAAENSRRLEYQARAATRTNEPKAEYADNAEKEKNENGYPKVVVKPRGRSPAPGQYADADQAEAEKSIPAAQRLPDCHRSLRIGGAALRCFLKVVMIVGYIWRFFMGVLMERRILSLCGLAVGAFILTFAFSSRYFGLWRSDAAPSAAAATQPAIRPPEAVSTPAGEPAPAAATMNPSPAIAPPETVQSQSNSTPDADNGERENAERPARGDRAAERGARTR
jgi:hypothetical protein